MGSDRTGMIGLRRLVDMGPLQDPIGRRGGLAPGVLKRLVYKREVPAVTLLKLTDVAALPWHEQPERVFD
jgi:hypothetical protein